jgi:uncharacterized membrane protein
MNGWMDHMWNFWGMGWSMWIWLVVIIGLGYLFYTTIIPRTYKRQRQDPLELARMRLASGEITLDEFEKIKESIERSRRTR